MSTQFITLLPPPGPSILTHPLNPSFSSSPSFQEFPPTFTEALSVRLAVFVHEQHCSPAAEIDTDDPRSWHWVVYASVSGPGVSSSQDISADEEGKRRVSEGGRVPVGTIRLVPPPHGKHPENGKRYAGDEVVGLGTEDGGDTARGGSGSRLVDRATTHHDGKEPYVKLGRLATLREYRGLGLGRLLVKTALEWVAKHAELMAEGPKDPVQREREGNAAEKGAEGEWRGLVLAHAQREVVEWYRGMGFVEDEGMGRWWEEGIEHVGMWKRVDVGS